MPRRARPATRLSHVDAAGKAVMVDVGAKAVTAREAWAQGTVTMSAAALRAVRTKTVAKGDVLQVARLAGIMAAKQTASLIPLVSSAAAQPYPGGPDADPPGLPHRRARPYLGTDRRRDGSADRGVGGRPHCL